MRIAIIGTGRVAQALAAGWTKAGHDLTLGSRDPRAKQGLGVTVAGLADATRPADVVVNATPGASSLASLTQAGAGALDGKVLIDVANAVTDAGGLAYPDSSLAEELQKAFPTVTVVKALNTTNTSVMTNPGALAATTVFLSGDDAQAKARAAALAQDLGWPAAAIIDLGGLTSARGPEHYFVLFMGLLQALGTSTFNINVVH